LKKSLRDNLACGAKPEILPTYVSKSKHVYGPYKTYSDNM
jgi:hypothetical protein